MDGTQAVPQMPVDLRDLDADFYAWTGHKTYGPTGIGVLHGRRELLEAMPPFIGGGHMIRAVRRRVLLAELPWKFEAGTSQIAEAIGLGAAVDWLSAIGMAQVRAHEQSLVADALERLRRGPGPDPARPAGRRRSRRARVLHARRRPPARHRRDPRPPGRLRAGRPSLRPAAMRRLGAHATTRASFAVHNTPADIDRLIDGLDLVRRTLRLG